MGMPTAFKNAMAKIQQGPVAVVFDPGGANELEVFVKDGVDITFARGQEEQSVDLVGVYDLVSSGDSATFEINLTETSMDAIGVLFMDQTDGTTYWGVGLSAGQSARANAQKVRIRPWQTRSSSTTQIELFKCVPEGDAAISQKPSDPHTWTQTFRALPDLDQADGSLIGKLYAAAR